MKPGRKMDIAFIVGMILVAAASIAFFYFSLLRQANGQLPRTQIKINATTFNAELALTLAQKTRGLSFRSSLPADDGMLFVFNQASIQSFWMKDMNFPLDMIWINNNKVVGFTENIPPPAPGTALWNLVVYSSPPNTNKALEVNAGTVAKYNIKVGDPVQVVIQ